MNGAWTYKGGDSEGAGTSGVSAQEDEEMPDSEVAAAMLPFVPPAPQQEPM